MRGGDAIGILCVGRVSTAVDRSARGAAGWARVAGTRAAISTISTLRTQTPSTPTRLPTKAKGDNVDDATEQPIGRRAESRGEAEGGAHRAHREEKPTMHHRADAEADFAPNKTVRLAYFGATFLWASFNIDRAVSWLRLRPISSDLSLMRRAVVFRSFSG